MSVWIGVDPGARHTGVVARDGRDLLGALVIVRARDEHALHVGASYLGAVVAAIRTVHVRAGVDARLAVEDVTAPNPHVRVTDPESIIATGVVFGAVLASFPTATVVPAARNGSHDARLYPPALRPHRTAGAEQDGLSSRERPHARSAWDVAGHGPAFARLIRALDDRRRDDA